MVPAEVEAREPVFCTYTTRSWAAVGQGDCSPLAGSTSSGRQSAMVGETGSMHSDINGVITALLRHTEVVGLRWVNWSSAF